MFVDVEDGDVDVSRGEVHSVGHVDGQVVVSPGLPIKFARQHDVPVFGPDTGKGITVV